MKKISLITLMVGLLLLVLAGCVGDGVIPGTHSGDLEAGTITQDSGTENSEDTGDKENLEIIKADTIKPVITSTRSPLPNAFGWNNTEVIVSFTCEEVGPIQSGIVTNTVKGMTVTTEGEGQSVTNTGTCIDAAGNIADPIIVSGINIDKAPPVVIINLSKNGRYKVNESIEVSWTAEDRLSGLDESKALRKIKIDTKSKGKKKLIIPRGFIKDRAGNESEEIVIDYEVVDDENIVEPPINPVPVPPQEPGPKPEDPVPDIPDPNYIYPQQWATGNGTKNNPWAGDCIGKAITAASAGNTIYLQEGYYQLSGECAIKKSNLIIAGAGIGKTIVLTDNESGFYVDGYNYVTIQDLSVDGSAQANGKQYYCPVYFANCDYATLKNVEVYHAGYYGVNVFQVNHSLFENLSLHDNYVHGIHPGSNTAGRNHYNTYRNIDCYNNYIGFSDRGNGEARLLVPLESSHNIYENINTWNNGSNGILIAYQKDIVISGCTATDNSSAGIFLKAIGNADISNCFVSGNSRNSDSAGIYFMSATSDHPTYKNSNISLTNVVAKNNVGEDGVSIKNGADDITFSSCQFYDDQSKKTQDYGLRLSGLDISNIALINCQLTPNRLGAIYNPYNIAVNIITEKMLVKLY